MERKKKQVAIGALASVVLSVVGVGTALIADGSWVLIGNAVLILMGAAYAAVVAISGGREIHGATEADPRR